MGKKARNKKGKSSQKLSLREFHNSLIRNRLENVNNDDFIEHGHIHKLDRSAKCIQRFEIEEDEDLPEWEGECLNEDFDSITFHHSLVDPLVTDNAGKVPLLDPSTVVQEVAGIQSRKETSMGCGMVDENSGIQPMILGEKSHAPDLVQKVPMGNSTDVYSEPVTSPETVCAQKQGIPIPAANSWSGLFKGEVEKKTLAHSLKKYEVNYDNNQLQIPLEISKIGVKEWEHALVGYFIDRKLSFFQVKSWADKLWKGKLEEVVSLDNGHFVFKLKNEDALKSILEEDPYYFGSKLILIKKWHPGMSLTKEIFSSVPIWVKFFNVPLELWTEEGLSYIASMIGNPLYLDEFTLNHSCLTFARICIEVEATKVIPSSFVINLGYGEPFEIKVEVPWKPHMCEECKIFGHTIKSCPSKPTSQGPITYKQVWKAKLQEVAETNPLNPNEWEEVKKKKGKGHVTSPRVGSAFTHPSSSSNVFEVLSSCEVSEVIPPCMAPSNANVNCSALEVVSPGKEIVVNLSDPNEEMLKEENVPAGDGEKSNELGPRRSTRLKEAPQALSDGTFIVPWAKSSSRGANKKKLLERIANFQLSKGEKLSIKTKNSCSKSTKK